MTERAPTTTEEEFKPARLELVEELTTLSPESNEPSSRFEDIDEAHGAANMVNVQHDMLTEARANLEQVLAAKNSPLVEKYQQKVAVAEMNLNEQLKTKPRLNPSETTAQVPSAEDYDIAA